MEPRDAPQHKDLRLVHADEAPRRVSIKFLCALSRAVFAMQVVGVEVLAANTEEITWTKRMCKDATLLQVAALLQRDGRMNPSFVFADAERLGAERLLQAVGIHFPPSRAKFANEAS